MQKEECGMRKAGRRPAWRRSGFVLRHFPAVLFWLASGRLVAGGAATPDDIPRLRPPRGEIAPTFGEQYGLWVIITAVLLLGLLCAAVWWLRRPRPAVMVPPEAQARQALEPLRAQPEDGVLLSRVSQILRRYVGAAFGLPPGEMTTADFCRALAGHERLGAELSATVGDFLRSCDERKFAPPAARPALGAVDQGLKLIELAEARRAHLRQAEAQPPRAYRGASKV